MQLTQRSRHQAQQRKASYAVSVFVQALLAWEENEFTNEIRVEFSNAAKVHMPETFEYKQFQFFLQRLTLQLFFHIKLSNMQNSTMTSETLSWCNLDMLQSRCHAESKKRSHNMQTCCAVRSTLLAISRRDEKFLQNVQSVYIPVCARQTTNMHRKH